MKELGNSGTADEVCDSVIERLGIPETEQARVRNQIAWARFYLTKAGILDSSRRGVWALTEAGRIARLDAEEVYALFTRVHQQFPRKAGEQPLPAPTGPAGALPEEEVASYQDELLETLRSLPPNGFERICQRLLRESGFQQVIVTGRSGDGGIDGHGVLESIRW